MIASRDDGHIRPTVQTAATALEGLLQAVAEPGISGENLAIVFSVWEPAPLRTVLHAWQTATLNVPRGEYVVKLSVKKSGQPAVYAGGTRRGSQPDDWTHNLLIIRKNHAPEQMFCAPRLANSYQIDGHS